MTEIAIPFKAYFKNRMLTGKKTATSRTKQYGMPGDQFKAFGESFDINSVERVMLGDVAKMFYLNEGFATPEEFLECWASIHPRAKFDLTTPIWLHHFSLTRSHTNTRDKP